MWTWVVIGVIVLLVILIGAARTRAIPSRAGMDTLVGALGKRYLGEEWSDSFAPANNDQIRNADRLLAHAEQILDRQLRKAQGLLPFNAVILAVLSFEHGRMPDTLALPAGAKTAFGGAVARALAPFGPSEIHLFYLLIATMIGLALSSLLCLKLFSIGRGEIRADASLHRDVVSRFGLVRARSKAIAWATVLAQACLIVAVVLAAIAELNVRTGLAPPAISVQAETALPVRAAA